MLLVSMICQLSLVAQREPLETLNVIVQIVDNETKVFAL